MHADDVCCHGTCTAENAVWNRVIGMGFCPNFPSTPSPSPPQKKKKNTDCGQQWWWLFAADQSLVGVGRGVEGSRQGGGWTLAGNSEGVGWQVNEGGKRWWIVAGSSEGMGWLVDEGGKRW